MAKIAQTVESKLRQISHAVVFLITGINAILRLIKSQGFSLFNLIIQLSTYIEKEINLAKLYNCILSNACVSVFNTAIGHEATQVSNLVVFWERL